VPALVIVLVATGCVKAKPPGIRIADLESSIVFGLKPIGVVAPPGAPPQAPLPVAEPGAPAAADAPDLPAPPRLPAPKAPGLPTPSKPFCRTATINDFPTNATLGAPNPPNAGLYQFKKTPPELFGADRYNVGPLDLQRRLVFNVSKAQKSSNPYNGQPVGSQPVTTTTYTYDVATFLDATGKNFIVDRIKVTDNPITQSAGAVNFGPTEYTGQPDRGVTLQNRQLVQNGSTASFAPSSPLLLLPLPAVSGQTWQSVSYDPTSGATYTLYGKILNRQRVDACGDVVEGWAVEAQTVFKDPRSSSAQNANFKYYVDTANGGFIVYEKVEPIRSPSNPANGTPADAAVPASPTPPPNSAAAPASEFSLATRDPQPV